LHTISLNTQVEILKNKKIELAELNRRDQLDIEHSQRRIALYREMIDQAQSADEVTDLQTKIAREEQDLSDAKFDLAMRQQAILDTNADISLKEQQLFDAREELADTEAAIQDKREELFSAAIDAVGGPDTGMDIMAEGPIDAVGGPDTGMDIMAEGPMGYEKINTVKGSVKDGYSSVLDKFFGPMAGPNSTVAGAEASKTAAAKAADDQKKQAQADAAKPETGAPTTADAGGKGKEATLNDVVKSLDTLNKQVGLLNSEMSKLPNLMERSVKATKALNGNVNASV